MAAVPGPVALALDSEQEIRKHEAACGCVARCLAHAFTLFLRRRTLTRCCLAQPPFTSSCTYRWLLHRVGGGMCWRGGGGCGAAAAAATLLALWCCCADANAAVVQMPPRICWGQD
eukprot:349691-Chlamydomonas_euryale.AAC.4